MQAIDRIDVSPTARVVHKRLGPKELGFGPLFWAARDAVIVCDVARNEVLFCNPAVEQTYGYAPEDLEGQPLDIFIPDYLETTIREQSAKYVKDIQASPKGLDRKLTDPIEWPAVHKSGREIIVEFSVSPLDVPGEAFVFVIVRDITERKRLEAERDALLADFQETLRKEQELATLKSDFVAMIAHEAGSPIAAIAGMIDLLDRDELPAPSRRQISEALRSEVQIMHRLVRDVQDAASMDRGEFRVKLAPTSLECLLNEATLSAQAHLSGHDFTLEPVPEVIVMADRERISQVLRNLLGNAAKHTPPGTRVTLRARTGNGRVHLDVIDAGPGISQEDLEHIFTKFGRGRDATGKRLPGMGLGLYLSRGIVRDHGGTLFATSAPGKGTTFSFDLAEAP